MPPRYQLLKYTDFQEQPEEHEQRSSLEHLYHSLTDRCICYMLGLSVVTQTAAKGGGAKGRGWSGEKVLVWDDGPAGAMV